MAAAAQHPKVPTSNQPRRFPPPWSVEETDTCFVVRDANGHALAYVHFEDERGEVCGGSSPSPRRGAAGCGEHRQAVGAADTRNLGQRSSVFDFEAGELTRRTRKIIKQSKNLEALDTRRRHKLRIAIKKVRYACESFESVMRVAGSSAAAKSSSLL
jgi:hypothetical protein